MGVLGGLRTWAAGHNLAAGTLRTSLARAIRAPVWLAYWSTSWLMTRFALSGGVITCTGASTIPSLLSHVNCKMELFHTPQLLDPRFTWTAQHDMAQLGKVRFLSQCLRDWLFRNLTPLLSLKHEGNSL